MHYNCLRLIYQYRDKYKSTANDQDAARTKKMDADHEPCDAPAQVRFACRRGGDDAPPTWDCDPDTCKASCVPRNKIL